MPRFNRMVVNGAISDRNIFRHSVFVQVKCLQATNTKKYLLLKPHRLPSQAAHFYDNEILGYGSDIFLEKGKERVLSHEVTHVAQQKRGLVRPTEWVDGAPLNRAPDLERAADGGTVPAGPALPGGQVPVLQLHPEVKVVGSNGKEWVKQLKSAADIMDVLKGGGYEYARLP